MKRKVHISASTVIAALAGFHELYGEIRGTGQSVIDLLHSGWSFLEINRFFPLTLLNLAVIGGAVVWLLFHLKSGQSKNVA